MRALLLASLIALPAAGQTPGTCAPGAATGRLDVGDVDAGLYINGNLFFGSGAEADYRVLGGLGLYAANLWIGGLVGGEVRTSAGAYGPFEMWPGPLDAGAALPPEGCAPYDRIWVVTTDDIAAYDAGGVPAPDLADWPVGLGAPAVDAGGAPVVAASRAQTIDLAAGERPVVVGSQTAFWVMNDVGNAHARTGSAPLGVEVQVTAAAFRDAGPAFDTATLFRFRVVNRNAQRIRDARVTLFSDTNLGPDIPDERQGMDVARGLSYTYNQGETDAHFGVPPALGFDFLSTGIGAHRYGYNSPSGPANTPVTALEVRRTQLGRWPDGRPQTAFGSGYNTPGDTTVFAFPGDPVVGAFWSMENVDGAGTAQTGRNSRSFTSTPSVTLMPGAWMDVAIAIVFGQGADRLDSITRLREASDALQAAYDSGSLFPVADESGTPSATPLALAAPRPNPTTGAAEVVLTLPATGEARVRVRVTDVLGRTVGVVHDGPLAAGATVLRLPAGLAPGVYTVVAESGAGRAVRRLTIAR